MSFLSRLFKKQQELEPADLSVLGADMHSHLIPGIDDGSPDMETSLDLLRKFEALGYQKVLTTPHIMVDYYKNTSEIILSGLQELRAKARDANINLQIEAAAEYYLDEHFDKLIDEGDVLTFGKNYVLFELPFMAEPDMLKGTLFKLQMAGYQPILAHPERYLYWHRTPERLQELSDRDILLQLNINSLTGTYSPQVQKAAEWMIDRGLVDFLGSDCHHAGHLHLLQQARKLPYLHSVLKSPRIKNNQLLNA